MTPTLESIKSEQDKITKMIAAFESSIKPRAITIGPFAVTLNPGEEYAGIIHGKDGQQDHHLILLPGEAESVNWSAAKDWAAEAGGELPTRREQSLLYTNLKEQFQGAWYWSCEQHAVNSDYAWSQSFDDGFQYHSNKLSECRARAVRRVAI